jgi:hypothetical protein
MTDSHGNVTEVYIYRGTDGDRYSLEGVPLKDFRIEDGGHWLRTMRADATVNSGGFQNFTIRQKFMSGIIYNRSGGTRLRAYMRAGTGNVARVSKAYVGIAADDSHYDFDGAPTQLLFPDGSGSKTLGVNELATAEADFIIPPARDLLFSIYFDNTGATSIVENTSAPFCIATSISGDVASSVTVTPSFGPFLLDQWFITKVETLHGSPINAGQVQEFVCLPFDIKLPDVADQPLAKGQITIDGVGREISTELLEAIEQSVSIQVTYRPYITGQELNGPEIAQPIRFILSNVVISGFTVQGDIILPMHGTKRFPAEIYTVERFPSLGF